jgi:hypothetical protein
VGRLAHHGHVRLILRVAKIQLLNLMAMISGSDRERKRLRSICCIGPFEILVASGRRLDSLGGRFSGSMQTTTDNTKDDPDNRILECALTSRTEAIVTGDHALLTLADYRSIHVMSLRQYLGDT